MTLPGGGENIGRAEIEVGADTSRFPREAKTGVERAFEDIDPSAKKAGEDWGEEISQSLGTRMKSRVPEIVDKTMAEFDRQKIKEHIKIEPEYDKSHVKSVVRNIARDLEEEVTSGGGGGIFGKIGQGIADAIGAGFNVSGKSPLIALLVPVVGAIAALVLAAIQIVNGLIGALFSIPSILAAIAVQAGVMLLVFKTAAPVIAAVLNAQNAKELRAALMGVNKPLADFAVSLLPIRDFFSLLSKSATMEFFRALGNIVTQIFNADARTVFFGLIKVATALGSWLNTIGQAFTNKNFVNFLADLFSSIDHFLKRNGPYFEKFLEQLFKFLDKMLGPATDLGALFDLLLKVFGDWLDKASTDPEFLSWLDEVPVLLIDAGNAVAALIDLFKTLFEDINDQGGKDFLPNFIAAINVLNDIFKTDAGKLAIRGLIQIVELLGIAFIGLIVVFVSIIAFLEEVGHWIMWLVDRIKDLIHWIGNLGDYFGQIPGLLSTALSFLKDQFLALIRNAGTWGANLVSNFIDGALSKVPGLKQAFSFIANTAASFLPHSPAKQGPFSGSGSPMNRGVTTISDFAKGIMEGATAVSNATNSAMSSINFGPGAVIANFNGANPTPQQAQNLGTALGMGITNQLAARNARLAVRTM